MTSLSFINDILDEILLSDLGEQVARSQQRSMDTIAKYKNLIEIPNFESDTIAQLPSFRGFMLTAFEETQKCFDMLPTSLASTHGDSIVMAVRRKLDSLPSISPVDNCLISNKVQRPRFRHPTLDF